MPVESYFKYYPHLWLKAKRGLTMHQYGALVTVTMQMYQLQKPIPLDDKAIARSMGLYTKRWIKYRDALIEKRRLIVLDDNTLTSILFDASLIRSSNPDARKVTPAMRLAVFERDNWTCTYCGTTQGPFEADHIVPHSRGGDCSMDNLVCSCGPCNRSKGAKLLSEWEGAQ